MKRVLLVFAVLIIAFGLTLSSSYQVSADDTDSSVGDSERGFSDIPSDSSTLNEGNSDVPTDSGSSNEDSGDVPTSSGSSGTDLPKDVPKDSDTENKIKPVDSASSGTDLPKDVPKDSDTKNKIKPVDSAFERGKPTISDILGQSSGSDDNPLIDIIKKKGGASSGQLWSCTAWSVCTDGQQERVCTKNVLGYLNPDTKPLEVQPCVENLAAGVNDGNNGFFSRITGAVVGAIGTPAGAGATIFVVLVIGAAAGVGIRRRMVKK